MMLKFTRSTLAFVLTGLLATAVPIAGWAESLAGQVGDRRYAANFRNATGPCEKAYKQYVNAAGHSAYAQTPMGDRVEAFFCGRAYNAPSQKEAEERALADCNSVFKKYKVKTVGRCIIYASK